MNKSLYETKLKRIKSLIVPSLFTDRQFGVLIKRLENKKLSQTEKNYLSNAIKDKIKAVVLLSHINLKNLYEHKETKKELLDLIISCYKKSDMELIGYKLSKEKVIPPTEIIKKIFENYQEIDTRIADLLPVYILNNRDKIDLFEIHQFAIDNGIINFVGYIFDIVQNYSPSREFKEFIKSLEKNKDNIRILRDKRYKKIFNLIEQDDISRKWNIYTLNKLDDYRNYFELYGEKHAKT